MKRRSIIAALTTGLMALGMAAIASPALADHAPNHDYNISDSNPDLWCDFTIDNGNNLVWQTGDVVVDVRIFPDPGGNVGLPPDGSYVADAVDENTLFRLIGRTRADERIECEVLAGIHTLGGNPSTPCVGENFPPPCVGEDCPPPPCPGNSCAEREKGNEGVGNGEDPPPPGHEVNQNDGPGTSPGNPGSKGGNKP
jgi:hypothetical protein